jgi:hypothetical protein
MLNTTEFNRFPLYLAKQQAILIGRVSVTADSNLAGLPAYYHHSHGELLVGEYDNGELVPRHSLATDSRIMALNAAAFTELNIDVELSSIGEALKGAANLMKAGDIGAQQAHVYTLRDVQEFSRGEAATVLNVEPSTVDSHLYAARSKIEAAHGLSNEERRLTEA